MFAVGVGFVARKDFVPLVGWNRVFGSGVIPGGAVGIVDDVFDFSLGGADWLRDSLLHTFLLGHEFGIAAEQNVGTTASHVGGDSDHALASGLGNDFRLALVILGVEHNVADSLLQI